jgi:hypothetical protein
MGNNLDWYSRSCQTKRWSIYVGTQEVSRSVHRGGYQKGRGVPETTTINYRDQYTNFANVTRLTMINSWRQGIQYKVSERYDTVNLGTFVISTEVIHTMRSRNIEFIARRLKSKDETICIFW